MGFFSGETKIYVGTSIARVIPDEYIISSVKTGSLQSIIHKGRADEYIMEEAIKGLATRGGRYFRYGRDTYVFGLPKSNVIAPLSGALEVQDVLETIEGVPITLGYSFSGMLNYAHIARKVLVSTYDYDAITDELVSLSAIKGATVTLAKIILRGSSTKLQALPPEVFTAHTGSVAVEVDAGISTIGLDIRYEWTVFEYNTTTHVFENVVHTEDVTVTNDLTIPAYDVNADYFHAEYTVGGVTKYWEYRIGAGTYPTLDGIYEDEYTENGSFFPWVYFRYNAVSMDADPESTEYLHSKRLFEILNVNYAETVATIHTNPGIGDVQQAFLYAAVPALSSNKVDSEYLFKFFSVAYANEGGTPTALSRAAFEASLEYTTTSTPHANVIRDARMSTVLTHGGIWKRIVTGVIGPVGFYKNEAEMLNYGQELPDREGGLFTMDREISAHYYMKQISETQYEEIQVLGLALKYRVYGNYMTVGNLNTETQILLIPLDMSIVETFSLVKREELYARSLHYVFNSMVMEELEWYETGIFQDLLMITAIVVTVISVGATFQAIGAALALGTITVTQAVVIILVDTVYLMLEQLAFKLFVKAVGIENAFIIAVFAIIRGVYVGLQAETFKGFFANAERMLKISCNLMTSAAKDMQETLKELSLELEEFQAYAKEQFDMLKEVEKSLTSNNALQPMMLLGESPQEFYSRTIHGENIGMIPIHMVRQYVDNLLRLPTIQDTLRTMV